MYISSGIKKNALLTLVANHHMTVPKNENSRAVHWTASILRDDILQLIVASEHWSCKK